jgi:outer membrane protein OmpA-like peptidoglycan-associated protein
VAALGAAILGIVACTAALGDGAVPGGVTPSAAGPRAAMATAARNKRELDAAEAQLRRRIDAPLAGTGVVVLREAQRVIVRIPVRTLFDPDSAHAIPEAINEVPWSAVTQLLRRRRHLFAQIDVYSDSIGGQEENQALSEKRARSLVAALCAAGIAAPRLNPQGLGSVNALDGNDTPEGRDQNRRVEVVFALPGV